MFNSFYENMPPVEVGKSKSLTFVIVNFLVGILVILTLGSFIYSIIEETTTTTIKSLWSTIFTALPLYLVIRGVYLSYQFFFVPYNKKSYQVKYVGLQKMKRGYLFQLIFLGAVITSVAIETQGAWLISKIIYFAILVAILVFILGVYVGINGLLKPYKNELRESIIKQQEELQQRVMEGEGNGFSPNLGIFPSLQKPTVFVDDNQSKKESNEDVVVSSGGRVIDITDEISSGKVKEPSVEDEGEKPLSAF